jgi:sulfonate transport system substrate-binding protein
MKHRLVALSLALVASTAAAQEKPRVIRIGVASIGTGGRPVVGGGFTSIAADQGALEEEFKKDGIEVKYTYFAGAGPAVNEALANRQLDFAYQGDLPALVAKAGGLRTKLILATSRDSPIHIAVPADSPARSLEDLKGKRIAVFKGTNGQLAFWRFLAASGLSESDFKIINMSNYDGNAALLSHDIDAQVSGADLFQLVDRGVARIVASTKGNRLLGRLGHVLVTEEFEARYPALVQRLVNVLLRTADFESNPANRIKVFQIWSKSGTSFGAWKQEYQDFKIEERDSPLFDDFYRAHYKRLLQAAIDLKLVRKRFDVDAWLDPKYLERGLAELGLQGRWKPMDADGKLVAVSR